MKYDQIERRAYQIWQQRGCPLDSSVEDWHQAERELKLAEFFEGSATELGNFYPKGYLVAIFSDLGAAEHAVALLRAGEFTDENTIAVSGAEVIYTADTRTEKEGLWGLAMRELSRWIGTEEVYNDTSLRRAAEGAGFVMVHSPSDSLKTNAWGILEPLSPVAARYYSLGGIEHLAGEV
jgi:hypothetical protein